MCATQTGFDSTRYMWCTYWVSAAQSFSMPMVIALPDPWPLSARQVIVTHEGPLRIVDLVGHSDGHLEAIVSSPAGATLAQRDFQRIEVSQATFVGMLVILDDRGEIVMRVNGEELVSLADAAGDVYLVAARPEVVPQVSTECADIETVCAAAVTRRQERFASKTGFNDKRNLRRQKSRQEQLDDLGGAILRTDELCAAVNGGQLHFVPSLAAEIRSLTYWPNDSPTWNPLLLRVAAHNRLALPVFSMPPVGPPSMENAPSQIFLPEGPSIVRRHPGDELVDLEDALKVSVFIASDTKERRDLSAAEMIALTSNTMGAAHYDDTVALDVEAMQSVVMLKANLLDQLIVQVAETITALGRYVTDRAGQSNP